MKQTALSIEQWYKPFIFKSWGEARNVCVYTEVPPTPTVLCPSLFQGQNAAFYQKIERLFGRLNDPVYVCEHTAAFVFILYHSLTRRTASPLWA